MKKRKYILKEARVLIIVTTLVLTTIGIVPMTTVKPTPITNGQPEHDVGIKSIDKPQDGCAGGDLPMQVTVQNYGNNTEVTDVQMEVLKCESETILIDENFSGTFPPTGWTTDYWKQSNTNVAGEAAPEARVYKYDQYYGGQYYDNYIMSNSVDARGCCKVILKFNFSADIYYPGQCNFSVKWRKNSTSPWNDITPWSNPIMTGFTGSYNITINCSCGGCREDFQVIWEYTGYYYYYNYFYLDDVKLVKTCCIPEYAELMEYITIPVASQVVVNFPNWSPSDLGDPAYECLNITYCIRAFTILTPDENSSNDCKFKYVTLHFDSTPPATTHSFSPTSPTGNNNWYNSTVKVRFDATDNCDSVDHTNYSLDGGVTWTTHYGPWPFYVDVSSCVHDGDFQYYSVDKCGNVEPTVTVAGFKVDTINPGKILIPILGIVYIGIGWDGCSGFDKMQFYAGGAAWGGPIPIPIWPKFFPPAHPVTLTVWDKAGNWI